MLDNNPGIKTFLKGLAFLLGAAVIVAALASGFGALGIGAFGATAAISSAASFIGVPSAMGAIGSLIGVSSLSTAATLGVSGLAAGIGGAMMYPAGKDIAQKISNKMARDFGDQQYKQDLKATKEALKKAKAEVKAAEKQAKQEIKEAKNQYQKDYKARHDILDKKGIFGGKDRTDKLLDAVKSGDPVKITKQINKLRAAVNGVHLKDIDKIDPKQAGKSVAAVTKALVAVGKALKDESYQLNQKDKAGLETLRNSIEKKLNDAAKDIAKCDDKTKEKLQQSFRSNASDQDTLRWSNLSEFNAKIKTSKNLEKEQAQETSAKQERASEFKEHISTGIEVLKTYNRISQVVGALVDSKATKDPEQGNCDKLKADLTKKYTDLAKAYEGKGLSKDNANALATYDLCQHQDDNLAQLQDAVKPDLPSRKSAKPQQSMEAAADILAGIDLKGVSSSNTGTIGSATTVQAQGHVQGNQGREV